MFDLLNQYDNILSSVFVHRQCKSSPVIGKQVIYFLISSKTAKPVATNFGLKHLKDIRNLDCQIHDLRLLFIAFHGRGRKRGHFVSNFPRFCSCKLNTILVMMSMKFLRNSGNPSL